MNDIYSFYKLISEFKIEIPVIQRDYAQGRTESRATDVRESIVKSILDSVSRSNPKPLFFDFVYGRIEGDTFIPFDGQQRLTTLFLFHRYIFEKCKRKSKCMYRNNCQCISLLSRFTYTTRQSSREFCEQLINYNITPCTYSDNCKVTDCVNRSISEYIKDCSWFYPDWSKDPTIVGMLAMLDEIDRQCKAINNLDFRDIALKLTSGCVCPITFHFVNMGEHKLSDSTYIKMNARGKTLTSFENFKASLEQYLEERKHNDLLSKLKGTYDESQGKYTGIDGTWLDMFYNETKPNVPDLTMLSFFKRHFLNFYIATGGTEETVIDKLEKQITVDDFIPFSIFEKVLSGKENDVLMPLFNLLDALDSNYDDVMKNSLPVWYRGDYKKESEYAALLDAEKEKYNNIIWNLFKGNWNKKGQKSEDEETAGSERYQSRVMFYAVVKYFEIIKDKFCKDQFAQWMRVIWNYTENVRFDSFDDYKKDLTLVDNISQYLKQGCDFNNEFEACTSLTSRQSRIDEELTKVRLISSGATKWEKRINDLENHKYFTGEIKFMFDFLGVNPDETLFDTYSEIMRELFNDNGLNPNYDQNGDYRFRRALMYFSSSYAFGYEQKKNWSFLKNKDRDISWKRFISDSKNVGTGIPHNEILRWLIEGIHNQKANGKSYNDAFDFYLNYSTNVWDWRYCFVNNPNVWEYLSEDNFVRWDSENEIYLMKTTRMSGTHAELRTYYLDSKINRVNNWGKKYYDVAGREEQPCLYFEKEVDSETFVIDILWDINNGKGYYLNLFTRSADNINVTPRVSGNTQWGLQLSDPNSRYVSGFKNEKDIVDLATDIMNRI